MRKLCLFFVLATCLASCSLFKGNRASLSSTNFSEEVDLVQNLVFSFDQDLVPANYLDRWDSTQYIRFDPPVQGRFKWKTPSELVFSPAVAFAPSTDYQATTLPALVEQRSDVSLRLSESKVAFHTPYLNIKSAESYWTKSKQGALQARVLLRFNYAVYPKEVAELGQVLFDKEKVAFTIEGGEKSDVVVMNIAPDKLKSDEQSLELKLTLNPGLRCAESGYTSKEKLEYVVNFPNQDYFVISSIEPKHDGEQGEVRIYTTQALVAGQVASHIKIEPEVDYKVEVTEGGCVLTGNFSHTTVYDLRIDEHLTSVLGKRLGKAHEQSISFGELGENIQFINAKGTYLPGKGARNVAIRIVGVPEVKVRVTKIYENNLLAFFRSGSRSGYDYDNDSYNSYEYYETSDMGDVILEREHETKSLPRHNGSRLLDLDFTDKKADYKGIYLIEVTSKDKYYVRANKVVSISDIGLVVRDAGNEIWVFANSLAKADALSGLKLNLVSTNNQTIYTATTDGSGVAVFRDIPAKAPGFQQAMITAHAEADFNYLLLRNSRVETSRFDVGGKYVRGREYDAYLYGDREIYRPGDTVYVNSLVRTPGWDVVREMPVKLKVSLPNGKELTTLRGELNSQGAFATQFALQAAAVTGSYTLTLYTAADKQIASKNISVEEFMPDRIKVAVQLAKEQLRTSDKLQVGLTATNLFGPPAAGRNYEVELSLNRQYFSAKDYPDYDFSLSDGTEFKNITRQGSTDKQGQGNEVFDVFGDYANIGVIDGRVFVTVFDENGRPVNRVKSFEVFTQPTLFGIKSFDGYVSPRQPVSIPLIAVDMNGKALSNEQAQVQVVRNHWETVVERQGSSYRYVSKKREQMMSDKVVTVSGTNTNYIYTPPIAGEYEVRLYKPGAKAYVSRYFYAWGWGSNETASFEVNNEGNVVITADKKSYLTGESAELLFKTPFDGRLLITYERDGVLGYEYLKTENNAAKLTLSLKAQHVPNIYVTATLFRPMDGAAIPLTVAHGFVSLKVEEEKRKLPITITAAESSTSRKRQRISVQTAPNAQVTLAVVDEGILQIKNTQTPDPYAYYFAKRALEVSPHNLYMYLLPELRKGALKSSTGGDGYDLNRRVNPLTNKRVRLVSFWSGTLTADGSGQVDFDVNIPQFSGALRIMAVAYKDAAFGSGQKEMKVADPVVISTGLPRFLSPGDTVTVPVTLTNTTKQAANASAKISVSGPLRILGSATQNAPIQAGAETRVQFKLAAVGGIGLGQVKLDVGALGGSYNERIDITIRPASSLAKMDGAGAITGGQATTLDLNAGDYLQGTREAKLVISRSPLVQFSKNLTYLLGYPHGCIEQTISKAFPQLYYGDLVKSLNAQRVNYSPNWDINVAIDKIQSMQTSGGAISYWPGDDEPHYWGSAYAAHFLYEAEKAGFSVSATTQRNLREYLITRSSKKETEDYYIWRGNSYTKRSYARKEIFYALFALALQGHPQWATMNHYKATREQLTPDSRYLLAAAYALAGDMAAYNYMLPQSLESEYTRAEFGGSFSSPIRDRAIALYVLLAADPRNNQIGTLVRGLSEAMKKSYYLNTQESVFAFLALGKFAKLQAESSAAATVQVGGRAVGSFTGKDLVLTKEVAGQKVNLTTSGSGQLFYFWETSGIAVSGVPEEDARIKVRRSYYDRNGTQRFDGQFGQNELVVVKLSVSALENEYIENTVVTDLLPAGFEIENPRVASMPELGWIKDASSYAHMDVRDDRISFYTTASGTVRHYYYVVRAVSPGTYQVGPASADAMYRADYHSYHGAGRINISTRASDVE